MPETTHNTIREALDGTPVTGPAPTDPVDNVADVADVPDASITDQGSVLSLSVETTCTSLLLSPRHRAC